MRLLRSLAVSGALAVLTSSLVSPVAAQTPNGVLPAKGPLPVRDYEPLNTLFLLPLPTDASVLGRGRVRYDANLDIVNNLLTVSESGNKVYNTDFEEQRLYLSYARGLKGGQEVGIRVPLIARNGGMLDTFINNWHKLFSLKGGGRDDLPDYKVIYQINNANGQTIANTTRSTTGIGDIVLEYRKSLTPIQDDTTDIHRLAASARGFLKLPTGNSGTLTGSGAADIGAGLALTARPNRRLALHGNLSVVLIGNPRIANLNARSTQVHSLLSAEYLFNGRTSFVAQTDDVPSPLQSGISYTDRPRRGFTAGFWHQADRRNRVYFAISENDFGPLAKHAPDFTLSLGLRRTH
jgi:hypothetical protein